MSTSSSAARAAQVQERTVYRHFPTKADLQAGLWEWIPSRLTRTDFSAATAGCASGRPLRCRTGKETRHDPDHP